MTGPGVGRTRLSWSALEFDLCLLFELIASNLYWNPPLGFLLEVRCDLSEVPVQLSREIVRF